MRTAYQWLMNGYEDPYKAKLDAEFAGVTAQNQWHVKLKHHFPEHYKEWTFWQDGAQFEQGRYKRLFEIAVEKYYAQLTAKQKYLMWLTKENRPNEIVQLAPSLEDIWALTREKTSQDFMCALEWAILHNYEEIKIYFYGILTSGYILYNELHVQGSGNRYHSLTPLAWAIHTNLSIDIIQQLINARPEEVNTPRVLDAAICRNNVDAVRLILQIADPLDERHYVYSGLGYRTTPHITALRRKASLDIIKLLVDKGDAPTIADGSGETPLYVAAGEGRLDAIRHYHEECKELNWNKPIRYFQQTRSETPLQAAAAMGHAEVVLYLLSHIQNIDVNIGSREKSYATPIYLAAWHNHEQVVAILLKAKGIKLTIGSTNLIDTALGNAIESGHLGVAKLLYLPTYHEIFKNYLCLLQNIPGQDVGNNLEQENSFRVLQKIQAIFDQLSLVSGINEISFVVMKEVALKMKKFLAETQDENLNQIINQFVETMLKVYPGQELDTTLGVVRRQSW